MQFNWHCSDVYNIATSGILFVQVASYCMSSCSQSMQACTGVFNRSSKYSQTKIPDVASIIDFWV